MKPSGKSIASSAAPQEVGALGLRQQLEAMIAAGKCKQAVELAKENHKKQGSPESQQLLVHAYIARIQQFQSKGMMEEAQTLLTLVKERFPGERHQLGAIELHAAAAAGRLDELLQPLASEQTPTETRACIENVLSTRITDLAAIAACNALPPEHPIRTSAAAVWKAFLAVTTGPVTDEQIALPEVSRRSPWSAWKMLIRAIAAYYRHDDAGCRRALDAVPAESVVAHAAATLRMLVDEKKPAAGIGTMLYTRARVDDSPLRAALRMIDVELNYTDPDGLERKVFDAERLCVKLRSDLLMRMKQQIAVSCSAHGVPPEHVCRIFGPIPRTANFWRSLARRAYGQAPVALVAMYWERFLVHAVGEGLFTESSPEAAAVWLWIAEVLSNQSLEELERDKLNAARANMVSPHYADQSPEIQKLRPISDQAIAKRLLEPGYGFIQSSRIQPDAGTFTKWWEWADRSGLSVKAKEAVAMAWQRGRPRDVQPLVILSSLAEQRKAYSLAMKRLSEAEAIDPMNQSVRQARVRLTLSITWRHFADRKPHLVEKDIADLAALPSMGEGDRAAALDSIRASWHALRGEAAEEQACRQRVFDRMGEIAGQLVLDSIQVMAKVLHEATIVFPPVKASQALDAAKAQARAIRLADDLQLRLVRPKPWNNLVSQALRQRPCPLSEAEILSLGMAAMAAWQRDLAYDATAAGLSREIAPALTARFLLLRSRTIDAFGTGRILQCLAAALELARQAHDEDLIRDIFAQVDQKPLIRRVLASRGKGLSPELLKQVLANECKAQLPFKNAWGEDPAEVPALTESFDPFYDSYADDEEDDDDDSFGGIGPDFGLDGDDDEGEEDDENDQDNEDEQALLPFGSLNDPDSDMSFSVDDIEILQKRMTEMSPAEMTQIQSDPRQLIEFMAKSLGKKLSKSMMDAIVKDLVKKLDRDAGMGDRSGKNQRRGS